MLGYILRRLAWAPLVLAAVSLFTFTLGFFGPGDPVEIILGKRTDPEAAARLRHELGLDRPFLVQYGDYISKAARGDLGESYIYRGQPVAELIFHRMGVSAQLGLVAIFISVSLGIPLGLLAAMKQGSWLDTAIVSTALLFYALPAFITAPFLLYLFSLKLHWLPASGWGGIADPRIIMPAVVLGIPSIAVLARLMRASTLEVLGQDYIRTAYAKGLLRRTIVTFHISKNALLPVFTVIGLSLATLVEGAFITETVFGIPGIGRLTVDSLFSRDYPVIMALTLILALAFVLANLLADISYSFLDPRIRYQ